VHGLKRSSQSSMVCITTCAENLSVRRRGFGLWPLWYDVGFRKGRGLGALYEGMLEGLGLEADSRKWYVA